MEMNNNGLTSICTLLGYSTKNKIEDNLFLARGISAHALPPCNGKRKKKTQKTKPISYAGYLLHLNNCALLAIPIKFLYALLIFSMNRQLLK